MLSTYFVLRCLKIGFCRKILFEQWEISGNHFYNNRSNHTDFTLYILHSSIPQL